jgi:cytochrome c oxidase subunit IV
MAHLSYEDSKKRVIFGLSLLGIVTLVEVFFSLLGKGHIVAGVEDLSWVAYVIGFLLIAFSLYKAYFIIYEFMHMKYEVKGLAWSVLLPMTLLVWAVIAFFQEGNSWKMRRQNDGGTEVKTEKPVEKQGMYMKEEIYKLNGKG